MSSPVSVQVVEVVHVSFDRGGAAGEGGARPVNQYWSKDGRLLAEFDHIFHSPDVPAFEVLRLRAELADFKPNPPPAPVLPAQVAINCVVGEVANV